MKINVDSHVCLCWHFELWTTYPGDLQCRPLFINLQVVMFQKMIHGISKSGYNVLRVKELILILSWYYLLCAQMLGRTIFTINCNENLTLAIMLQLMTGMVQSGCWALFDNTDRLTTGIQCFVSSVTRGSTLFTESFNPQITFSALNIAIYKIAT